MQRLTPFLVLSTLGMLEAKTLQVEVLPHRPSIKKTSYERTQEPQATPLPLSQVWDDLRVLLNYDFFHEIIIPSKLEQVLEQAENEDFENQSLPLISKDMRKLIHLKKLKQQKPFIKLIKNLQIFIHQQEPSLKTMHVETFRGIFLRKLSEYQRTRIAKGKEWTSRLLTLATYDSNLNRVPENEAIPSRYSGKSDYQLYTQVNTQYRPTPKVRGRTFQLDFTAASLLHVDHQSNDLLLAKASPSYHWDGNLAHRWNLKWDSQILFSKFDSPSQFKARSHHHQATFGFELKDVFHEFLNYKHALMSLAYSEAKKFHFDSLNAPIDASISTVDFKWNIQATEKLKLLYSLQYRDYETDSSKSSDHGQFNHHFRITYPKSFSFHDKPLNFYTGYTFRQKEFSDYLGGYQKEEWDVYHFGIQSQIKKASVFFTVDYTDKADRLETDFLSPIESQTKQTRVSLGLGFPL